MRNRGAGPAYWLVLLCSAVAGCSPPDSHDRLGWDDPARQTRDSAGVVVVENRRPAWGEGEEWRVEGSPELSVGGHDTDPDQQLWQVRGARVRGDGTLLVVNGGTNELRWYGRDGQLIHTVGGTGEGPGEFGLIVGPFVVPGDSIVVVDYRLHRLSIFTPDVEFVRSVSYTGQFTSNPIARFGDGTYLMVTTGYAVGADGPTRTERMTMSVARLDERGALEDVTTLPWLEVVIGPTGRRLGDGSPVIAQNPRAFGRNTWVVGDSAGWIVADNARAELQHRAPRGQVTRVVGWTAPERPVTSEDVERHTEARLSRYADPERRRRTREAIASHPPPPETMPPFGASWLAYRGEPLILDDERNTWVKEYAPFGGQETNRYLVFDSAGTWLGTVSLPSSLQLRSIAHGHVVGVVEDELEVETVAVHRLVKEQEPG